MASDRTLRRSRRWRARLALLAIGCVAAGVCAEIAVRIGWAVLDPDMVSASQHREHDVAQPMPGRPVRLGHLIRAARHHDIVFELVPDLDVEFLGVPVRTNEFGFRGPSRTKGKPPGAWRIVGLGDSVLFGWGVRYEDTGLARLEALVQKTAPGRVVEAIDTAVPGYNTAMEACVLREKGLAFAPDLVLVDFVGNDLDLPNYLWRRPDYWRLDHSFLWDLVKRSASWREEELHGPFVWAPMRDAGAFEQDPERVPPEYRHLVGLGAFRRALEDIAAAGRANGFPVLVTCHHDLWREVRAVCDAIPLPVVQIGERVNRYLHDNGHAALLGSPLALSATDPHPTPMVHEWWAEAVFQRLSELGWLPR